MSWTSPKTWVGSEVLTSSDMNTYVGSNLDYLYDNAVMANSWVNGTVVTTEANQRMESGSEWMAITTGSLGSVAVVFDSAFANPPRVVATANAGANRGCAALSTGTGGFTLCIVIPTTGTVTGTLSAFWMALGA